MALSPPPRHRPRECNEPRPRRDSCEHFHKSDKRCHRKWAGDRATPSPCDSYSPRRVIKKKGR